MFYVSSFAQEAKILKMNYSDTLKYKKIQNIYSDQAGKIKGRGPFLALNVSLHRARTALMSAAIYDQS